MSVDLSALSEQLAAAVERAAGSVVQVRGGPAYRRRAAASGVAWSAEEVLTTAHTLSRRLEVILPDGQAKPAEILGIDPASDLALLRVAGAGLAAPGWRDLAGLKVGNLLLTVGRGAAGPQATLGVLSALGGPWRTAGGAQVEGLIEVDATLPLASAGGLLVDVTGAAVGLNTHALRRGGCSLPYATLQRIAPLLAGGGPKRGWLGLGVQETHLPEGQRQAAGQDRGLLVLSVAPESPAAKGGILVGDILLAAGEDPLAAPGELLAALHGRAGEALALRLLRGGAVASATVTPEARAEARGGCG